MTKEQISMILFLGFFLMGVLFLCIGLGIMRYCSKKRRVCTQYVNATIVKIIRTSINHAGASGAVAHTYTYYPVYQYTVNGRTIQRKGFVGGKKKSFTVGEVRTLMVNPEKPDEMYDPKDSSGFLSKVFLFVGILLCIVGIGIICVFNFLL